MSRDAGLGRALEGALVGLDAHVHRDPIRFPGRYKAPGDVEIAAVYAAQLAFGRVELFGPVLARLFAEMDAVGGPASWVAEGGPDTGDPLVYRWFGRADLLALAGALARLQAAEGLAAAFSGPTGEAAIEVGVTRLRALVDDRSARGRFFDTWFARPSSGSACKRWCMFLRWMVRPGAPDLGIWTHLSPATLVMPVDTHVLRIAQLTGLTDRRTADWKTALQITSRLRDYSADDPIRYDFALAHLGISSGCTGTASPACDGCAMRSVCRVHVPG